MDNIYQNNIVALTFSIYLYAAAIIFHMNFLYFSRSQPLSAWHAFALLCKNTISIDNVSGFFVVVVRLFLYGLRTKNVHSNYANGMFLDREKWKREKRMVWIKFYLLRRLVRLQFRARTANNDTIKQQFQQNK